MPRQRFGEAAGRRREMRQAADAETTPPRRLPALEEVIIALQKSLARSQRDARDRSRTEAGFLEGDQPLYIVDAIDLDLNVALHVDEAKGEGAPQRMLLDFDAPPEERSSLKLRVESRPLEALAETEGKVILADLEPDRGDSLRRRLMASFIGPERADRELELLVEGEGVIERIPFRTNRLGQAEILIDPTRNTYSIGGGMPSSLGKLDLSQASEFFTWVETPLRDKTPASRILHTQGPELEADAELERS
jgi:hypothetical protein